MDVHRIGATALTPLRQSPPPKPLPATSFRATCESILAAVDRVIDGKAEASRVALTVLLAQGHLLVEDVPGVGKTMLAKTLARTIDCSVSRIQFTPDLLPSDVTGVSIYNQATRQFEFRPGAVFANIVIGDEINRASAKTQSALLECMEEHQVTVDGTSYGLSEPFMVIATQNPIEMEGTYPLPEAQRDRFMARISMGYPDEAAEIEMLESHQSESPLLSVEPVAEASDLLAMIETVKDVFVSDPVKEFTVALGRATRTSEKIRLGSSPRAVLQLLRAAKARAALDGRDFVLPDDIAAMAPAVLTHRLILDRRAASAGLTAAGILEAIVASVPLPSDGAARLRRQG
ncbi:AAA family ATPase [Sinomonas albida]|uniref:AAA family ATPase n=1 Tax=Sinomonas albida TaxID=369942 RepID=UPI0010A8760C|nr:MoxR family ATPase [Sinomonas albida]